MNETQKTEGNLSEEFRNLGHNLAEALRSVWESPERRHLQQDIESGLVELRETMKEEIHNIAESPTGQKIRSEVGGVGERLRSGEVESKVRQELLAALRKVNIELEKASQQWSEYQDRERERETGKAPAPGEDAPGSPEKRTEVHPDDVESVPSTEEHTEVHPDDVESEPGPQTTEGA